MTNQALSLSFGFIVCRYFSKWRLKMSKEKYKKKEKGCNHPPHLLTLAAYPTPD